MIPRKPRTIRSRRVSSESRRARADAPGRLVGSGGRSMVTVMGRFRPGPDQPEIVAITVSALATTEAGRATKCSFAKRVGVLPPVGELAKARKVRMAWASAALDW